MPIFPARELVFARLFTGFGFVLSTAVVSRGTFDSANAYLFAAGFVFLPWLLPLALVIKRWHLRGTALGALLMLSLEAWLFYDVFLHPRGSTAALAYVFKPFIQLLALMPVGLLLCWPFDKRARLADLGRASQTPLSVR